MAIEIVEEGVERLAEYGRIPIAFLVTSQLRVEPVNNGLGGFRLIEEMVDPPYIKDYDQYGQPPHWATQWNIDHWGLLAAYDGSQRVGGALVAWQTSNVYMLEGRDDLAVLWDIRVAPAYRQQGVGKRLFRRAVQWAQNKGCKELKIETQNINVAACRFYAKQGCTLGVIHRRAYPDLPHEAQLLWYLPLISASESKL